jgi:phosphonate transport system permease protein
MAQIFDPSRFSAIVSRHQEVMRLGERQRQMIFAGSFLGFLLLVFGLIEADFSLSRIINGTGKLGDFAVLMFPPEPGPLFATYLHALGETLAIALLGTVIAAVLAFPFAVLASRNVLPFWLTRFVVRRSFDTIRGVDTLIWALIWISVVGLGPFAGVLAVATADFAAFGKLFSETIETADPKPVEGIRSTGGTAAQEFRFGILPQILPVIAGQILYYFESNTRSATIIGIVGAGGIGLHLSEQIRTLEWQRVAFLVLMVLAVVAVIDFISSRLRTAISGAKPI